MSFTIPVEVYKKLAEKVVIVNKETLEFLSRIIFGVLR